jgi:hypothetical protein
MNFGDLMQMVDPVKWVDDAVTMGANGESVLLLWDSTVHTGAEVERLLRSFGVACYGRKYPMSDDPTAGCHVRTAQAKYADGLMRGAGFAVLSRQLSPPIRPARQWGVPAKAQGLGGVVGDLMGVMDVVDRRNRQRRKERY